jgi:hypothetical protein
MEPGHGWVFHGPVGVEFPETEEGVQPDIIFVSKARSERLVKEGIRGAPDRLSRSSRRARHSATGQSS